MMGSAPTLATQPPSIAIPSAPASSDARRRGLNNEASEA